MNLWGRIASEELESRPIVSYIKDSDNNKKGMLVAAKYNGQICLGWSLCCESDKFDKYDGFSIAEGRLFKNKRMEDNYVEKDNSFLAKVEEFLGGDGSMSRNSLLDAPVLYFFEIVPRTIQKYVKDFQDRVARYFKNERFSDVFEYLYNVDDYKYLANKADDLM